MDELRRVVPGGNNSYQEDQGRGYFARELGEKVREEAGRRQSKARFRRQWP